MARRRRQRCTHARTHLSAALAPGVEATELLSRRSNFGRCGRVIAADKPGDVSLVLCMCGEPIALCILDWPEGYSSIRLLLHQAAAASSRAARESQYESGRRTRRPSPGSDLNMGGLRPLLFAGGNQQRQRTACGRRPLDPEVARLDTTKRRAAALTDLDSIVDIRSHVADL